MNPEGSAWGVQEHLTALVADLLNVANWQRSGDAKAPRPDPVARPGDSRPQKRGHTKEEIDEWLARRQVAAKQDDETEG